MTQYYDIFDRCKSFQRFFQRFGHCLLPVEITIFAAKATQMIQRIQTVYLLLAILSMALMFAFKIAAVPAETGEAVFTLYGATLGDQSLSLDILTVPPYVYNIVIIAALFACVLMFRNRKTQMMIGRLSYLLILGFLVFLYFAGDAMVSAVTATDTIGYGAGIYFPVAAIAFVFLANRAI